jgi:Spy/CpxP family protein refolding chaperone
MKQTTRTTVRIAFAAALALAVAAVLGVGAHAALARGGFPGHHGVDGAEHMARLATALGLSDQQKAAARKLHEQTAAKAGPLREQARLQHDEIEAMLESGSADPAELGQRLIEMHATHKKLEALHAQTFASLRAQLSAEQRGKLDKLHQGHGGPGGHGMGGHGGPCAALSFAD